MFNKSGGDGTGKANIQPNQGGIVHSVLYLPTKSSLQRLDKYEGISEVETANKQKIQAEYSAANPQRIPNNPNPGENIS